VSTCLRITALSSLGLVIAIVAGLTLPPTGQAGGRELHDSALVTGPGSAPGTFPVTDEGGIAFWTEFQNLGAVASVGYPISDRFVKDGFICQAFQKLIFQWRPEAQTVYALNILDIMHDAGQDGWLWAVRATPPLADWGSDSGKSWDDVVANHLRFLTDPDIRNAYYAGSDPLTLYGLPMSPIETAGDVVVLRTQRIVLQKWLIDTPWARSGEVTVANSGEIAMEAGILSQGPTTVRTPTPSPFPIATSMAAPPPPETTHPTGDLPNPSGRPASSRPGSTPSGETTPMPPSGGLATPTPTPTFGPGP